MDRMLSPLLTDKDPCYIFFRLDDRNVQKNYLWVFMSYIPDYAVVSWCIYSVYSRSPSIIIIAIPSTLCRLTVAAIKIIMAC